VSFGNEGNIQLECPLGKDLKPSMSSPPLLRSGLVHMPDVTMTQFGLLTTFFKMGVTRKSSIFERSGRQRDSRSGRGFPNMSFIPCVIMNAVASESARPIQPIFHSQSFLLQISALDVPLLAVGPGTKSMHTTKMMPAGAINETRIRSHVGMVS
jgi:hypothetical protein